MRPLTLAFAAAALLGASASAAAPPSVSLNGVNIDGVTSQRFDHATVVIDAQGNVDIQVKGYEARSTEITVKQRPQTGAGGGAGGPGAAAGKMSRRYFVAVENTPPGTQYDLAIFVNAQWIREVKSAEPSAVIEITKYLRAGQNRVTLAATKRLAGQRLAYGREVTLKVVGGEGNVGGDHVMIDVPLFETTRTAAEMDDKTEEFVFDAR
ncbi:MAG TPA: hypothetical protein VF875_07380 [Anaeromyxobacter sp.]